MHLLEGNGDEIMTIVLMIQTGRMVFVYVKCTFSLEETLQTVISVPLLISFLCKNN